MTWKSTNLIIRVPAIFNWTPQIANPVDRNSWTEDKVQILYRRLKPVWNHMANNYVQTFQHFVQLLLLLLLLLLSFFIYLVNLDSARHDHHSVGSYQTT